MRNVGNNKKICRNLIVVTVNKIDFITVHIFVSKINKQKIKLAAPARNATSNSGKPCM